MIVGGQQASEPRLAAEPLVNGIDQGQRGILAEPAADPLDLASAPGERLVEIGEGLGDRLARGPGGPRLLGLDRPEVLDRLPKARDHRLALLDQAPAALGLELQLVTQRREFLDELDQAELGAA